LSDDVASDFGELGVVENVGVVVGIASIALPVPESQTTSSLVGVAVEILSIARGIPNCRLFPVYVSAMLEILQIKKLLKTSSFSIC